MDVTVSTQTQENNAKIGYSILFAKDSFLVTQDLKRIKDLRSFDDVENSLYRPHYIFDDRSTSEVEIRRLAWHLALDVPYYSSQQPLDGECSVFCFCMYVSSAFAVAYMIAYCSTTAQKTLKN